MVKILGINGYRVTGRGVEVSGFTLSGRWESQGSKWLVLCPTVQFKLKVHLPFMKKIIFKQRTLWALYENDLNYQLDFKSKLTYRTWSNPLEYYPCLNIHIKYEGLRHCSPLRLSNELSPGNQRKKREERTKGVEERPERIIKKGSLSEHVLRNRVPNETT